MLRPFFFLFAMGIFGNAGILNLHGQNTVKGVIHLPNAKEAFTKGSGYNKDGSPIMQSEDPMASANRNTIVILRPRSFEPTLSPVSNATITQKEQTFLPMVLPVTKGTVVYFLNEDEFFHNIYSLTPGARFNIGRRPPGSPYPIKIKRTGLIKLSCDIHPHMEGFILSLDTPFFTRTDANGKFLLEDLPDGAYDLEVFHPFEKNYTQTLTLSGGEIWEKPINLDGN